MQEVTKAIHQLMEETVKKYLEAGDVEGAKSFLISVTGSVRQLNARIAASLTQRQVGVKLADNHKRKDG